MFQIADNTIVDFYRKRAARRDVSPDDLWFTDQDDVAANAERLTVLTQVWAIILSNYLSKADERFPFTLGHLRCGTTASDTGNLQIEDLAAIPDLVAGSLSEALTCFDKEGRRPNSRLVLPPPQSLPEKARRIIGWLTDGTMPLRRQVFSIERTDHSSHFTIKRLVFHGTSQSKWL